MPGSIDYTQLSYSVMKANNPLVGLIEIETNWECIGPPGSF